MVKNVLILSFLILITSCKGTDSATTQKQENNAEKLAGGSLYGNGNEGFDKGHQLIKNRVDLKAFIKKMNQSNDVIKPKSIDLIDFDDSMLLAIFDKVRTTGGYSLVFDEVKQEKGRYIVKTNMEKPGEMASSVMTQPYLILKLPKTDKEVTVER